MRGRDGPPDKRLFRSARQGDRRAYLALLRRHDMRLRRLVLRLVAEPDRVDPILRRAYVRAWRSLASVQLSGSVAEWLYRIVYNTCINELRWAPRRPPPPPAEGPRVPLPVASVERRLAGLRALTAEERIPLALVDGEGFSLEAAARILRRPPVEVAADLSRARGRWRSFVVGEGGDARETGGRPEVVELEPQAGEGPAGSPIGEPPGLQHRHVRVVGGSDGDGDGDGESAGGAVAGPDPGAGAGAGGRPGGAPEAAPSAPRTPPRRRHATTAVEPAEPAERVDVLRPQAGTSQEVPEPAEPEPAERVRVVGAAAADDTVPQVEPELSEPVEGPPSESAVAELIDGQVTGGVDVASPAAAGEPVDVEQVERVERVDVAASHDGAGPRVADPASAGRPEQQPAEPVEPAAPGEPAEAGGAAPAAVPAARDRKVAGTVATVGADRPASDTGEVVAVIDVASSSAKPDGGRAGVDVVGAGDGEARPSSPDAPVTGQPAPEADREPSGGQVEGSEPPAARGAEGAGRSVEEAARTGGIDPTPGPGAEGAAAGRSDGADRDRPGDHVETAPPRSETAPASEVAAADGVGRAAEAPAGSGGDTGSAATARKGRATGGSGGSATSRSRRGRGGGRTRPAAKAATRGPETATGTGPSGDGEHRGASASPAASPSPSDPDPDPDSASASDSGSASDSASAEMGGAEAAPPAPAPSRRGRRTGKRRGATGADVPAGSRPQADGNGAAAPGDSPTAAGGEPPPAADGPTAAGDSSPGAGDTASSPPASGSSGGGRARRTRPRESTRRDRSGGRTSSTKGTAAGRTGSSEDGADVKASADEPREAS